jgi:NAD(P)-dependent dehydrogenase (short-subunit alcohol dehydrogenase family)
MKKKILLTGSNGKIGKFIEKNLRKKFTIISVDKKNNLENENNLKKIFKNKIFAIIFSHGYNSTPIIKKSKNKKLINFTEIEKFFDTNVLLNLKIIDFYLRSSKKGRVINLSSIYSIRSPKHFIYKDFNKDIGYGISKSAANIMIKYLGTKFAKNFKFNSLILGGVAQEGLDNFFLKNYKKNNPSGRMMNYKEIIPAINFLLDDENTHTNAQEIIVDGGWTSW